MTTVRVVERNLGQPLGSTQIVVVGLKVRLVGLKVADIPVVGRPVPFSVARLKVTVPEKPSRAATVIVEVAPVRVGPILAGVAVRLKSGM